MADDEKIAVQTSQAPQAPDKSDAKKIKLKFAKPHNHNGKQYGVGSEDVFTQADADLIRAQGTASTVTGQ
jgi:hypothetical protein